MKGIIKICFLFALMFSVAPAVAQISLYLNQGAEATNSTELDVEITAKGAVEMLISEDINFEGATWQPFKASSKFRLDKVEGEHYVFVKVKYSDGEITAAVAKKIFLDTKPPTNGFINVTTGTYITKNEGLELELFAKDAAEMMLSNNPDFAGARWIEYRHYLTWRVPAGEGEKRIYAKFRDKAKNETEVLRDIIQLDLTPPKNGSFKILADPVTRDPNTGIKVTQQQKKTLALELFADEAKYMMLSNDYNFFGARWELYRDYIEEWQMPTDKDGTYTIYVKFKDLAQNESEVYSDTLVIDTRAPYGGRMRINKGETVTNDANITLDIRCSEAQEMMLSIDPGFGGVDWEPYRTTREFKLPVKDDIHTVYVSFRDVAGNVSTPAQASIRLDNTPPQNGTITILSEEPYTLEDRVKVRLQAEDAAQMQLSTQANFSDSFWKKYRPTPQEIILGTSLGKKIIYARFQDDVGNISKVIADTITVANEPVLCKINIKGNEKFCNDANKQVALEISAINAIEMQLSQTEDFTAAAWQPYQDKFSLTLEGEEGEKRIFARFKSVYGVISKPVETRVILDSTAPKGTIQLNEGVFITIQSLINVRLEAEGADLMQIGLQSDLSDAAWMSYRENYTLDLGVQKGTRTIYARLKDAAGNLSDILSDSVSYAILTARNAIEIDGGQAFTKQKEGKVKLSLFASNALEMQVSNSADFNNAQWEVFAKEKEWQLTPEDGEKQVFARFRSQTKTVSETQVANIILDREAPKGSIKMANSNRTKASNVEVSISTQNADFMQVSTSADFTGAMWTNIRPNAFFNLGSAIGKTHHFYARFKDEAGNISETVTDSVIYELTPFRNQLVMNGGSEYVNNPERKVEIELNSQSAEEMQLSESPDFEGATWEAYNSQKTFQLSEGDGKKTVYVRFKSKTSTVSETAIANIVLDTEKPTGTLEVNNGEWQTIQPLISVKITAKGADFMQVGLASDLSDVPWRKVETTFKVDLGVTKGDRYVYARFKDQAGNLSNIAIDTVSYAILPVRNALVINGGDKFTNAEDASVNLELFSRNAVEMQLSNQPDFEGVSWEKFQPKKTWQLLDADGKKTVFAKFRTITQTESEVVADTITLDRLQPSGSLRLELTEESHKDPVLLVYPKSPHATHMQLSETPNFEGRYWEAFRERPLPIRFINRGEKIVYVQYRDAANNISDIISDTLILEIYPYASNFEIDRGSRYTTNPDKKVTLGIFCRDAQEMMISNNADFKGGVWEPYQEVKDWILEGEDGEKTVYITFRSSTKTAGGILNKSITLDRDPPSNPQILVNNGAESTLDAYVSVAVKAEGAVGMQISLSKNFEGAVWSNYSESSFRFDLPSVGGTHTLYARFRDNNDNISAIVSDDILLEINPLETDFTIDNKAIYCTDKNGNVQLQLFARSAKEVMISNTANFSRGKWQPFKSNIPWQLSSEDGEKEVFVKFRSATQTESAPISRKIIFDRQPPVNCDITLEQDLWTESSRIRVFAKATDAVLMQLSEDANFFEVRWLPFTDQLTYLGLSKGDGEKTVHAQFKDEAGNISRVIRKSLAIDTRIPKVGKIAINDGAGYTNSTEVEVTLLSDDAVEMRLSNELKDFTDALPWRPYAVKFPETIDSFDGTHQIFAQLKDAAGNVGRVISTSIVLDTEAPAEGTFYIREGDYCKNTSKLIHLDFSVSHASQMIVSNKADFSEGEWEHLKASRTWTLEGEDGLKIVYAKFADEAGNTSKTVAKEIFLDTTYPTGEIIANNGDKITNDPIVNLHLDVEDASEMIISDHPHFSGVDWQTFTPEYQWKVNATNGLKRIYARFRDQVGNLSPVYEADILLDMQPPVPKVAQVNIPPELGNDNLIQLETQRIELYITAIEASFIRIANSEEELALSQWTPYLNTPGKDWMQITWELSPLDLQAASEGRNPTWKDEQVGIQGQLKTIYYQLKDNADNESTVFKKEVMLYAPKPMEVFIWKWQ